MKIQICLCILLLSLFLPMTSYSNDLDESSFAYMSYLGMKNQIEFYKDFCNGDEDHLVLIFEAEKEFIKRNPQWLDIKNSPPINSSQIKAEADKEHEIMNKQIKEILANAPRELFCNNFSTKLRTLSFLEFIEVAREKFEYYKKICELPNKLINRTENTSVQN